MFYINLLKQLIVIVDEIIENNQNQVTAYRGGNEAKL